MPHQKNMTDYKKTIQKIINSIKEFSFEFDIENVKKEMELQEVSSDELKKLGENKVQEKFNNGIFKIKMPNGDLFDANSIKKQSQEKNIKEPVIFINPNFKYVQWIVKKDFTTQQIKRHIKNQLTNNSDINLAEIKKELLIKEMELQKVEGYIGRLPIKVSNNIKEGKFYIQSSCSTESAIKMVFEVIEELNKEKVIYVKSKIRSDYKKIVFYILFLFFVFLLWFANKLCETLPDWISNAIAFTLFFISFFVMRLINHKIFDTLLHKKKVEEKYEKEFYNRVK